MKTIIDIPADVLVKAMRHTGARTMREAVVTAVADFNRRRRMAAQARHLGTCRNSMSVEELLRMRRSE